MSVRYLLIFFLFFSTQLKAEAESDSFTDRNNTERVSAALNFQKFLMTKYEEKATRTEAGDDQDESSNWEYLQHERVEDVVDEVNSMFQPLQDYFNYKLLTGYHSGDDTYHVGSVAKHISKVLQTLPDITVLPRLTWLWRWILSGKTERGSCAKKLFLDLLGEELELKKRIEDKIRNGEVLYTNRKRNGGFLYHSLETNPWWHKMLTFCQTSADQFGPKSFACSFLADFGLTLLIKLVFLRDLLICGGLTVVTGDTNLCLAFYISKLAFPGWLGDYDTPWIVHNVHL